MEFIDAVCRADQAAGSVAAKDRGTRFGFLQGAAQHGRYSQDPCTAA